MRIVKKVTTIFLLIGIVFVFLISIYNFLFGHEIITNVEFTGALEANVTSCRCLGIEYKKAYWPGIPWECYGLHLMCSTSHRKPFGLLGMRN